METSNEFFQSLFPIYNIQLGRYPTPVSISYYWGFGSQAGILFAFQVITGLGLAAIYIPTVEGAPESLESINRDGFYSWLTRAAHANGPSAIFAAIYLHMARSILIAARSTVAWTTGLILFVLFIAAAFLGYVLVWSQMSFWAATVITNLVTVVPYGDQLLSLIWGSNAIDQSTLSRFFAWHYLVPMIILAVVVIHIMSVHHLGSSGTTTISSPDKVAFMRYYVAKDGIGLMLGELGSIVLLFLAPNLLADAELFVPVDTMSTPQHIVPEWYLLFLYAMLRCIPNKACGCLLVLLVFVLLLHHVTKPN